MTTKKETLIQKATEFGKNAFAPAVEFTNVTIRVADRSARQQFQNTSDYAKFSLQQVKALPKVRNLNDAKSLFEEARGGVKTFAKQSFAVARQAANDYQGWFKESLDCIKKTAKPVKKAARKSTAKAKTKTSANKAAA